MITSNIETSYKALLKNVLNNGDHRPSRTGIPARSLFDQTLRYNLNRFPLLTSKFVSFNIIKTEFEWFMNGETNIQRFKDKNIKIWDAWADAHGELGPVYGYQMRNFGGHAVDQFKNVISSINSDPFGRRHIISLWNPADTPKMRLPPCYLYFQFYVSGQLLSMKVIQRSADLFIGIPYDIGLFALLLIEVSNACGRKPNEISLSMVDAHIYENHVPQVHKYLSNPQHDLPAWDNAEHVRIIDYKHEPKIQAPVAI